MTAPTKAERLARVRKPPTLSLIRRYVRRRGISFTTKGATLTVTERKVKGTNTVYQRVYTLTWYRGCRQWQTVVEIQAGFDSVANRIFGERIVNTHRRYYPNMTERKK